MFGAGARLNVTLQPATMVQNIANHLVALLALSFSLGHCLNEEDFQYLLKEVKHLRSRQDVLEERVEKLEELAKIGTLRTCAEYAQYGLKTSGLYMVDPDGPLLGQPPFQVFCNFDAGKDYFVPRIAFGIQFNSYIYQGQLRLCTMWRI